MRIRALAIFTAGALAGCAVGPNYVRPDVVAPTEWRIEYQSAAEAANTKWWEQFGDPQLNDLIETALRDNHDVRAAAARIDQFISQRTAIRSQLFPQVGYAADAQRLDLGNVKLPPNFPVETSSYSTTYQAALGASWQLDLFGRVRRLDQAAQAQIYASVQAKRTAFCEARFQ